MLNKKLNDFLIHKEKIVRGIHKFVNDKIKEVFSIVIMYSSIPNIRV